MKGVPDSYYPDDLEPVPTMHDLVKMGLASVLERNTKGEATVVRASPEGQQLIYDAMSRNATRSQRTPRPR